MYICSILVQGLTVAFLFPALAAVILVHCFDIADGRTRVATPFTSLVAVRVTQEGRVFNANIG